MRWTAVLFVPALFWLLNVAYAEEESGATTTNMARDSLVKQDSIQPSPFAGSGRGYPEMGCSTLGDMANGCDQCFRGGTAYPGQHIGNLSNDFTAGSSKTVLFFNKPGAIKTDILQDRFVWMESKDMWELNSELFTENSPSRGPYMALQPYQTAHHLVRTKKGTGFGFVSAPATGGDRAVPAFKIRITTNFFTETDNFVKEATFDTCVFLYASWCGDGVKDDKEQCDLGDKNGSAEVSCNSQCKFVVR